MRARGRAAIARVVAIAFEAYEEQRHDIVYLMRNKLRVTEVIDFADIAKKNLAFDVGHIMNKTDNGPSHGNHITGF